LPLSVLLRRICSCLSGLVLLWRDIFHKHYTGNTGSPFWPPRGDKELRVASQLWQRVITAYSKVLSRRSPERCEENRKPQNLFVRCPVFNIYLEQSVQICRELFFVIGRGSAKRLLRHSLFNNDIVHCVAGMSDNEKCRFSVKSWNV
jgi:hypothetical protein